MNKKIDLCSISLSSLIEWMKEKQEKSFRGKQIFEWLYKNFVTSFDDMTNLSKDFRKKLKENFSFPLLTIREIQTADRKDTIKFLFQLSDGYFIETVLIFSENRRTLCVSSQVGCKGGCIFCASGKEGFFRHLIPAEMIEQVLFVNKFLKEKEEKISHVVFMGMGEPLDNYENIIKTLRLLIQKDGLNLSPRRITISTVGITEKILLLAEEGFPINLALSLHAPNQKLREKIIPYAKKYPLEKLFSALKIYIQRTKRNITLEYILLSGMNDSISCAKILSHLIDKKHMTVNLIPYNPIYECSFNRPKKEEIKKFAETLRKLDITVTRRYTKGKDIAAACGQLALQKMDFKSS